VQQRQALQGFIKQLPDVAYFTSPICLDGAFLDGLLEIYRLVLALPYSSSSRVSALMVPAAIRSWVSL
jgi:hypothetical protein